MVFLMAPAEHAPIVSRGVLQQDACLQQVRYDSDTITCLTSVYSSREYADKSLP